MRKYLYLVFILVIGMFLVSCNNDEDEVRTSFKITYFIEKTEISLTPQKYEFIDETILPEYFKEDHLFVGWYENANFTGEVVTVIPRGSTGDKIFYGKVLSANKLTLNFNGGVDTDYQEFFHAEEEVILPISVIKDGYAFMGWYEDPNFLGEPFTKINIGTTKDVSLTAKFLKLHQLSLNFNGGEEVTYQTLFHSEEVVILPVNIVKENYVFAGWYTKASLTGDPITEIPKRTNTNLTLYAKFEAKTTTLTLIFNGGDVISYDNLIKYDEDLILPANINKTYYEFAGWYDNEFFMGNRVYMIPMYTTNDVTLYANYDLSYAIFDYVSMPEEDTFITSSMSIENSILDDLFYVTFDNINTDIIDNDGTLRRPYQEQVVTLTIKITDYQKEIFKDYTYYVPGYKSLTSGPIRGGYIYSGYKDVDDYYFLNQEILWTAFALADSNGNFSLAGNPAYFGNVRLDIMPRAKEVGTRVIMSVGPGTSWSSFSPSAEKRENFANNVVELINQYGFDGVDIDWETPRSSAGENKYYTELMKVLYQKVKANNPNHLVTTAITGGSSQGGHYDLINSGQYIDYINLMTYSMASNSGLYQNALYQNSSWHNPTFLAGRTPGDATVNNTISIFNNSFRIPSNKLIVGIAFYGVKQTRRFNEETNSWTNWSLFGSVNYENMLIEINKVGQTRVFDNVSKVPYVINDEGTVFISYEDPESIQLKAEYIIANGVAGMMYWQFNQDFNNILLKAMVDNLPKS